MKSRIVLFSFFCSVLTASAQFYSDVTFVGSVHTGSYQAISGISVGTTNGGYYTNGGARTSTYRLCGTNENGRIPLSTNIVKTWTPGTGTNAIVLAWTRSPGINRHVVEKSYDLGVTWTNWLTVAPGTATWTDTGSNTWSTNVFTNACAAISAATYPWSDAVTNGLGSGASTVTKSNGVLVVSTPVPTDYGARVSGLEYRVGQDELSLGELALVVDAQYSTPPFQFAQADYFTDQALYSASPNSSNVDYIAASDWYILGRGTPSDKLVLHYKLNDNATSTAVENSMSSLYQGAAWANSSTLSRGGKILLAFTNNGTDANYISVGNVASFSASMVSNTACTVALWISTRTDNRYITGGINAAAADEALALAVGPENSHKFVCYIGSLSGWKASTATVDDGAWHHVAFVSSNTAYTFYVDGSAAGSGTSSAVPTLNTSTPFRIGASHVGNNAFNGLMDDVRMYSRALTATEIAALYNAGTGTESEYTDVPTSGCLQSTALVAATNCTTGSLQLLVDTAGYESGAYTLTSTSLWAQASANNGTTFTNVTLASRGRWTDTNYTSLRGSFTFPVVGSNLVWKVNLSNSCPAKLKGSIIWGVPQ